jgi:hypothetical protein
MIPKIQKWLNSSISSSTGYIPVELFDQEPVPCIFKELLQKKPDQSPTEETLANKILKAYAKSKLKSEKRKARRRTGQNKWTPKVDERVSVRKQPTSDVRLGITSKFQRSYEGPYVMQATINPSLVELKDSMGNYKGLFNKKHLKRYHEANREEKETPKEISAYVSKVTSEDRTITDEYWERWKIRPPPKRKKKRIPNIIETATSISKCL